MTVRIADDVAEVRFHPDHANRGKVHRPHFRGLVACLPFGQRLTIQINGAFDGDHQRRYAEHAINIGVAATATLDLPSFREMDERVPLY